MTSLHIRVSSKWWLPIYLSSLELFINITRREPDIDKLAAFLSKHAFTYTFEAE